MAHVAAAKAASEDQPTKQASVAQHEVKETQLAGISVGLEMTLSVDALSHQTLKGHVLEISPAAGSEFSVIKPDNATGNFTKVTQRIPVRIEIDPDQPLVAQLRPGMSVEVSIDKAKGTARS